MSKVSTMVDEGLFIALSAVLSGVKYETISDLKGVTQLDKLDATHAILLVTNGTGFDLKTIELP